MANILKKSAPRFTGSAGLNVDLQCGIAEAVDQCVNLLALLAVGAIMVVKALVVRQIRDGVDRTDGVTADLIHSAVNSGNACHMTAVIMNGFNGALCGKTGGNRSHQHQNVLAADHGLNVIAENDLRIGVILRLHNVDSLVGIDGTEARLGQFVGNAGTQNGSTVQTQDGIHRSVVDEIGNQLIGAVLCVSVKQSWSKFLPMICSILPKH